jgi:choline dehydrogenase-like flavoprotein
VITDLNLVDNVPSELFDVAIIGGGTCGLILADALLDKGLRVGVFESGGAAQSDSANVLNDVEQTGDHYRGSSAGRMRALGGTSHIWGGALIPFLENDISKRDYLNLDSWPIHYSEFTKYIPELESLFELQSGSYESEYMGDASINPLKDDPSFKNRFAKWPRFSIRNTSNLVGKKISKSEHLTVYLNGTVDSFTESTDDSASVTNIGVKRLDGVNFSFSAKKFVIAAGAIESTRLLLLRQAAGSSAISSANESLGRGFNDHISVRAAEILVKDATALNRLIGFRFHGKTMRSHRFELSEEEQKSSGMASAWVHISFEAPANSAFGTIREIMQVAQGGALPSFKSLFRMLIDLPYIGRMIFWRVFRRQLLAPKGSRFFVNLVGEQLPKVNNYIKLAESRDLLGVQIPQIHWRVGDDDLATLHRTGLLFEKYWSRYYRDSIGRLEWVCDLETGFNSSLVSGSDIFHPSGTTRMAECPEKGVVDSNLLVFGTNNLYVLSTSVFPNGASANPTMMLLLLALRLGSHLSEPLNN